MLVELETERLRLSQWNERHFDAYAAFCSDEDLCRYLGGTCSRVEAWREMSGLAGHWLLRGFGFWAVEDKASEQFAGYCGLWFPEGWPEQEIGWGLLHGFHGRGYATEAGLKARDYAYSRLGWTTAVSYMDPRNVASKRVAERMGAVFEKEIEIAPGTAAVYRHPSPTEDDPKAVQ